MQSFQNLIDMSLTFRFLKQVKLIFFYKDKLSKNQKEHLNLPRFKGNIY